jgi:hypothetical protein
MEGGEACASDELVRAVVETEDAEMRGQDG